MRFIVTAVCLVAVSCLGIAMEPAATKGGDPVAGKLLFAAKCVTCHAKDAKGNPAMAKMFKTDQEKMNLTAEDAQKRSPEDLAKIVTGGQNKMPSFKSKLKEDEIANVVAFVKSLGAGDAPAKPTAPAK